MINELAQKALEHTDNEVNAAMNTLLDGEALSALGCHDQAEAEDALADLEELNIAFFRFGGPIIGIGNGHKEAIKDTENRSGITLSVIPRPALKPTVSEFPSHEQVPAYENLEPGEIYHSVMSKKVLSAVLKGDLNSYLVNESGRLIHSSEK